ncbi:hypothetical protein DICVIV_14095 [Dictyocaulus viviparus]|uniref:Uncharacterized protein n=1 Tax=Dictyocaulus viviparus TaxID=29172 RepID=A0A0D8X664_DICVI|nr:hypothetical protein DICVIV_14095 [Dictyocaulus viviparus]
MNFSTNHTLLRVNINGIVNNKLKKWYCDNIDGDVVNTIISFNGKIDGLVNDYLSDVVIVADIENGCVRFNGDFEQVEGLNDDLILKNNNLTIAVNSAKFQSFTIDSGNVEMNFLDNEESVPVINGKATSDAYGLYEPIKFKLDDMIQVTKDKIGGMAKSVFSFRIFNLNVDNKKVDLAKFSFGDRQSGCLWCKSW